MTAFSEQSAATQTGPSLATGGSRASFRCPKCLADVVPVESEARCPHCNWHGRAFTFTPPARRFDLASEAMDGEATCAHHPTKQAVAICEGTGDYICSLCAVELDGHTFSASYLSNAGRERLAERFSRYVSRPDRSLGGLLILTLLFSIAGPILIGIGIYFYIRMIRQRQTNPFYRRLIRLSTVVSYTLVLLLFAALSGFVIYLMFFGEF